MIGFKTIYIMKINADIKELCSFHSTGIHLICQLGLFRKVRIYWPTPS
jgi:hypothetical protein